VLERVFEKSPGDEAEKKRRDELLTYVIDLLRTGFSDPPSTLKTIGETLGSLEQKSALLRFTDHVQDNEEVSGLLEDLQEAINDYQVCSRP